MTEAPAPVEKNKEKGKPSHATKIISIAAVIIALLAIIVALWVWQKASRDENQLNMNQHTNKASMAARISDLNGNMQRQQQRLDTTNDDVMRLMKSVGNPGRPQALSEISYLINLASLQLSLNKDAEAAIHYLTLAKQRAGQMSDPSLTQLQRALDNDLNTLKALPQFDKTNMIIKLDDINTKISQLSVIPDLKKSNNTIQTNSADQATHWYERLWNNIKGLKELVVIRHRDQKMEPLLNKDEEQLVKQRIAARINQIEWAVLNHNNRLYQYNIKLIQECLAKDFHDAEQVNMINTQLDQLAKIDVAPTMPSINESIKAIVDILQGIASNNVSTNPNRTKPIVKPSKQPNMDATSNPNPGVAT